MSSNAATTALEEWLRGNGGFLHPNLRIAEDEETGIHWLATGAIEPETTVLEVPNSLSLSYLNGLVDDAFPVFKQHRAAFKVEAIGFFYLMAQYIHRASSFWKPYLDTLPSPDSDFSQPLWFDQPPEIALLEGTDVWHGAEERRKVYEQYYENGIAALSQSGVDVAPYTWHLFKWAVTMFSSRSFTSRSLQPQDNRFWPAYTTNLAGQRQVMPLDLLSATREDLIFPVLYPAMDASNHRHDAKVEWDFKSGSFSLKTLDGAQANHQLWNNYGAKPNDELFLGYGFCIPNNPFDTVLMTLKAPPLDLQRDIQAIHSEYLTSDGTWNSDKTTFRLALPKDNDDNDPSAIFSKLPEPLLELMLYILRHERGLAFNTIPNAAEYLTAQHSPGRRYLPHVARMLVQSLAPKLSKLPPTDPNFPNSNSAKHQHAATYVESQRSLITTLISALKDFTRSLILLPQQVPSSDDPGLNTLLSTPRLLPLESLHRLVFPKQEKQDEDISPFQAGLALSTNSTDLSQLRLAGWEDDCFVLLLCWMLLSGHPLLSERNLPEYVLGDHTNTRGPQEVSAEEEERVRSELWPIIHAAAEGLPETVWGDERWFSDGFVARVGGRMIGFEGFMVMCPVLEEAKDVEGMGVDEGEAFRVVGEEPRLCVYLHA